MDRFWLITWTCYGTWLPGDRRGFVSYVNDNNDNRVIHNLPGTPFDADMPGLEKYTRNKMNGPPVKLDKRDADALIAQYLETARIRSWELQSASVMCNHTHVVMGLPGDPNPDAILLTTALPKNGRARLLPSRSSRRQDGSAGASPSQWH